MRNCNGTGPECGARVFSVSAGQMPYEYAGIRKRCFVHCPLMEIIPRVWTGRHPACGLRHVQILLCTIYFTADTHRIP